MFQLQKRTGLNPMAKFGDAYDQLGKEFDDIFHFFGFPTTNGLNNCPSFSPPINVSETDTSYLIDVELPGLKKEDISINISDKNVLVIKGEKKKETSENKKEVYQYEFIYGAFHREMSLPDNINKKDIKASCKEGILKIEIPKNKKEILPSQKIEIT